MAEPPASNRPPERGDPPNAKRDGYSDIEVEVDPAPIALSDGEARGRRFTLRRARFDPEATQDRAPGKRRDSRFRLAAVLVAVGGASLGALVTLALTEPPSHTPRERVADERAGEAGAASEIGAGARFPVDAAQQERAAEDPIQIRPDRGEALATADTPPVPPPISAEDLALLGLSPDPADPEEPVEILREPWRPPTAGAKRAGAGALVEGDALASVLAAAGAEEAEKTAAPAWRRYAAAAPDTGDRPILSIVIDDLGRQPEQDARVLSLDAPITAAVFPDALDGVLLVGALRDRGHEVLLHVPMRPKGPEDPGADAIAPEAPPALNAERLARHLARFEGYVGINNHMGSAATASAAAMAPLMATLKARGLLFLDSRTTGDSVAEAEARRAGVPTARNDLFLDHERDPVRIRARLAQAERLAERRGAAVAIGHPHPETLDEIERWLAERDPDRVALVPLTAVIARAGAPASD